MKGYLVDTNIPSEFTHNQPDIRVADFIRKAGQENLFLSVMTVGEICKGIDLLPVSQKRAGLQAWLDIELRSWFVGRIFPVIETIAERWGHLDVPAWVPVAFEIDIEATEWREEFNHILRGRFGRGRSRRNGRGLFEQVRDVSLKRAAAAYGLAGKLGANLGCDVNGDHHAAALLSSHVPTLVRAPVRRQPYRQT